MNRLIDAILNTKKTPERHGQELRTLKGFIFEALNLGYHETKKSHDVLNPKPNITEK